MILSFGLHKGLNQKSSWIRLGSMLTKTACAMEQMWTRSKLWTFLSTVRMTISPTSFPGSSLFLKKKYPGLYSWSGVYACQPKPHRGWVLNLILSLLSREVNVLLLHRHYFEREASYLSEILPDQCFISTWTSVSVRCWLRGNFAYISLLFLNNRQQPARDQFNQFFTPKDLNNREIIDGMLSSRSYFVDWELDLPLNSFKTKAAGFCNCSTKFFTARESNDRQTFDCMNSIKFEASLFAKHWTYQTLNKCINASVVILPIEKYKLLNQAYSARRRCWCQVQGNDSQTVDGNNSVKSKTTFVGARTTYLTLNQWVRCDFAEWKRKLNSLCGPFIVVVVISKFFAKVFHTQRIPKTIQLSTGKIQPNAELTF